MFDYLKYLFDGKFHEGGYINGNPLKHETLDSAYRKARSDYRERQSKIRDMLHVKVQEAQMMHNTLIFYRSLLLFTEEHRN
jgi:hypothetical protein